MSTTTATAAQHAIWAPNLQRFDLSPGWGLTPSYDERQIGDRSDPAIPAGSTSRCSPRRSYAPVIEVLLLCTANICRSPVAAALLARALDERGVEARVSSAGRRSGGWSATPENVEVMRRRGVDLAGHRSTEATPGLVAGSDLVLGMAREHVRDALALDRDVWPRAFTLKELVRRGDAIGPRQDGETLGEWLTRAAGDRDLSAMLGSSHDDDVQDPIGQPVGRYEATADEIDALVTRLVALAWSSDLPLASGSGPGAPPRAG